MTPASRSLAAPTFPAVTGETLAGEALSLPAGLQGEKNLVLMGLGRDPDLF